MWSSASSLAGLRAHPDAFNWAAYAAESEHNSNRANRTSGGAPPFSYVEFRMVYRSLSAQHLDLGLTARTIDIPAIRGMPIQGRPQTQTGTHIAAQPKTRTRPGKNRKRAQTRRRCRDSILTNGSSSGGIAARTTGAAAEKESREFACLARDRRHLEFDRPRAPAIAVAAIGTRLTTG